MNIRSWLPWVMLAAGGVIGVVCHQLARGSSRSKDCGAFWADVTRWTGFALFPLLCVSAMIETLSPELWLTGRHLYFDRVAGSWWAFPAAIALPFIVWLIVLIVALARNHQDRGTWLVGAIGDSWSRKWVLLFVPLLLLPVLGYGRTHFGLGNDSYPAATWGAASVLAISLIGMAFSEGAREILGVSATLVELAVSLTVLPPWPESLAELGIETAQLARWETTLAPPPVNRAARDFAERLKHQGSATVSPQVVESIHRLVSSTSEQSEMEPACLILAPDHCGQIETVALAASDLAMRRNESTLIVTPGSHSSVPAQLRRWFPRIVFGGQPGGRRTVEAIEMVAGSEIPERAAVWVVDAATLSDDLMIRLTTGDPNNPGRAILSRFGLFVYWDMHCYTGILAANFWAISRRLQRLMTAYGRMGARTLALVRYAEHGDAQLARFIGKLLPHHFPADSQIYVGRSFPRTVVLHQLTRHHGYFEKDRHQTIPQKTRYPELVAALESARLGWPTSLTTREAIAAEDLSEALDLSVAEARLRDVLVLDPTQAGAEVGRISSSDALSVVEMIAQGGRASLPGLVHHCAIAPTDNPYVNYVLERLKEPRSQVQASRRLVSSKGHAAIYRRHLLLALNEMDDTRSGLVRLMVGEEGIIDDTLEELARAGKLTAQEVRFLDRNDQKEERRIEQIYSSSLSRHHERRPLDVAGDRMMEVRDPAAGDEDNGVRMRIDRERLSIVAYPGRVFLAGGRRYRVADWDTYPQDWIPCSPESRQVQTWRERHCSVTRMTEVGSIENAGKGGMLLKQVPVRVRYDELVSYRLERTFDLTRGTHSDDRFRIRTSDLGTSFETKAILLYFEPPPPQRDLQALCLALRHVLPVHLGVEEDALEVVQVNGQNLEPMQGPAQDHGQNHTQDYGKDPRQGQYSVRVYGLAIVDLYPQGIGLVDAIEEDGMALVLKLLKWSRDWLTSAQEEMQRGGANPLRSPLANATGGEEHPAKALSLLTKIVDA